MDLEIVPEPSPEEREALLVALRELGDAPVPPAYRSAWRLAGLDEEEESR